MLDWNPVPVIVIDAPPPVLPLAGWSDSMVSVVAEPARNQLEVLRSRDLSMNPRLTTAELS